MFTSKVVTETAKRDRILASMSEAKAFTYHLTGSRYFGNPRPDSDYDFFTDSNTADHYEFLKNLGFIKESCKYDRDPYVSFVYRHPCGIDIQFVGNAKLKRIAQSILQFFYAETKETVASTYTTRRRWMLAHTIATNLMKDLDLLRG